jgi:septal ring factor EnvC (AmiA/AmiB activator)
MDNEQLIDRVQTLLLGMEERTNVRFDKMDSRLGSLETRLGVVETRLGSLETRLGSVETKLDSVHRELTLNNELLAPFIRWSHSVENEIIRLSAQLQEVQARLAKLENPQTQ